MSDRKQDDTKTSTPSKPSSAQKKTWRQSLQLHAHRKSSAEETKKLSSQIESARADLTTATADLGALKKQLEEARAESERIRAHYEKKLAKERKAKSETEKTCERLAKQNAELQRRLRTLTAPLTPIDDPAPVPAPESKDAPSTATEKGAKKTKSAAATPLPPLPQVPPARAAAVADGLTPRSSPHRRCASEHPRGCAKGSSALSQFIRP